MVFLLSVLYTCEIPSLLSHVFVSVDLNLHCFSSLLFIYHWWDPLFHFP